MSSPLLRNAHFLNNSFRQRSHSKSEWESRTHLLPLVPLEIPLVEWLFGRFSRKLPFLCGMLLAMFPSVQWAQTVSFAGAQSTVGASGLSSPQAVAVDAAGDLFIVDTANNAVVKIPANGGAQSTVGSGLSSPQAVAVDPAGNVFIADSGNNRVVKVAVGGAQSAVGIGLSFPSGVALDPAGNVFIADTGNNRVVGVVNGTQSTITGASFSYPMGLAEDASYHLYVADTGNNRVVQLSPFGVAQIYSTNLSYPAGVAVDTAGDVFIADTGNDRVVEEPSNGGAQIAIGNQLAAPYGVAVDASGDVFIADTGNSRLVDWQTVSVNLGRANICPVGQTTPAPCSQTATLNYSLTGSSNNSLPAPTVLTAGATGASLDFSAANSACTETNSTTNSYACTLDVTFAPTLPGARPGAISFPGGLETYVYGVGVGPLVAFWPRNPIALTTASNGLSSANGVAIDGDGDVFVADSIRSRVIELPAGGGTPTTVLSGIGFPESVAVDAAGDVFIGDVANDDVEEVLAKGGAPISVYQYNGLWPIGLAVDGAGDLFIADLGLNQILKLPAGGGGPTVVASGFTALQAIAVDAAGNIFAADTTAGEIVEITVAGVRSTVVSHLAYPAGVAVDAAGDLFVSYNGNLLEIPSAGAQTFLSSGLLPGPLAVDAFGNIFFADEYDIEVYEIQRSTPPTLNFNSSSVASGASPSQSVQFQNIGNAPLEVKALSVSANFSQVDGPGTPADCSASTTLTPGGGCNLSISFNPVTAGPLEGTAVLTDNALNGNPATQSIALSGIGQAPQSETTLTSSAGTAMLGQPVVLTAIVGPIQVTKSGVVTFSTGTKDLGTAALNSSGIATLTTTALPLGDDLITARFPGSQTTSPSSGNVSVLVEAPTAVPVISPAGGTYPSARTVAIKDITAGAFIYYTTDGSAPTISSARYFEPFTIYENETVNAIAAVPDHLASATASEAYQITSLIPTTTTLASLANPATNGQSVTFTATVTAPVGGTPTGMVTFYDGTVASPPVALVAGTATYIPATLAEGNIHVIRATYNGSTTDAKSVANTLIQVVQSPTTTTISSTSPNPSNEGQSVTFTARVVATAGSTPTGTVTFYNSATLLGQVTLTNGAGSLSTSLLPGGFEAITAIYTGTGTEPLDTTSTSAVYTQTVLIPTHTQLSASYNPSSVGQPALFKALVNAISGATPTGSVQFFNGSTLIGTSPLNGGEADLTTSSLPAGNLSISAFYLGSNSTAEMASRSAIVAQVVQIPTTTVLSSLSSTSSYAQKVILTATVSGTGVAPMGVVTFLSGGTELGNASVYNGVATLTTVSLAVGSDSITASYSGDAFVFELPSISVPLSQTVNLIATTTSLISWTNPSTSPIASFRATVQAASGPTPQGTVTFYNGTVSLGSASLSGGVANFSTSALSLGSHSITVVYQGNSVTGDASSTSPALIQVVNSLGGGGGGGCGATAECAIM